MHFRVIWAFMYMCVHVRIPRSRVFGGPAFFSLPEPTTVPGQDSDMSWLRVIGYDSFFYSLFGFDVYKQGPLKGQYQPAILLSESDCILCLQVLCLSPLILTNSCQSMVKMSSMPTAAKTWGTWTPTSLLWRKKPTSRWPGKKTLNPAVLGSQRAERAVSNFLGCFCPVVEWWFQIE